MSMNLIKSDDFYLHKNIKFPKCKDKLRGILFSRIDSPGHFGNISLNEALTR